MVQSNEGTEVPEPVREEKSISQEPIDNESEDEDAEHESTPVRDDDDAKEEDQNGDEEEDEQNGDEEEEKPKLTKAMSTESINNEEIENKDVTNGDAAETEGGPVYVHVKNLKRPYTLASLHNLLKKYGEFNPDSDFWIDNIRSHCIVRYATVAAAEQAKSELDKTEWPPGNMTDIIVADSSQSEFDACRGVLRKVIRNDSVEEPLLPAKRAKYSPDSSKEEEEEQSVRGKSPKRVETKSIEELFRKTKAEPAIYYLPLNDEEAARNQARKALERREKIASPVVVPEPTRRRDKRASPVPVPDSARRRQVSPSPPPVPEKKLRGVSPKRSVSPDKSMSPSPPPRRRRASPRKRSPSLKRRSPSPPPARRPSKRSVSPKPRSSKRSMSPKPRSSRRSITPKRKSPRRDVSPKRRSPRRSDSSLKRRSPVRSRSPRRRSPRRRSPVRRRS